MWWLGPSFFLLLQPPPLSQQDQREAMRPTSNSLTGSLYRDSAWLWRGPMLHSAFPLCFSPGSSLPLTFPHTYSSNFLLYPTLNPYKPILNINEIQLLFEKLSGKILFFEMAPLFPLPLKGKQSLPHLSFPLITPHTAGGLLF